MMTQSRMGKHAMLHERKTGSCEMTTTNLKLMTSSEGLNHCKLIFKHRPELRAHLKKQNV